MQSKSNAAANSREGFVPNICVPRWNSRWNTSRIWKGEEVVTFARFRLQLERLLLANRPSQTGATAERFPAWLLLFALTFTAEFRVSRTCYKMVVNHACRLHEGVADR